MKTIICGSRSITDYDYVTDAITECINKHSVEISEVVCGWADGVDTIGAEWAHELGLPVKAFPADWEKHGKAAGPIRNQEMVDYADITIAITNGSAGTEHTIRMSKEKGIPTYVRRVSK